MVALPSLCKLKSTYISVAIDLYSSSNRWLVISLVTKVRHVNDTLPVIGSR